MMRKKENPEIFGELYNPSKRYQVTIGIAGFGTKNAHIIPINEFDHEDWECPKCHSCMQNVILYKSKTVRCQECGLELWREEHWVIQAKE
jgi:hypothetical protein